MRSSHRFLLISVLLLGVLGVGTHAPLKATPPFGHPDQPYDRLPGTLQTSHVPWARPLTGGKLAVLFVCPYNNSREVVELAQRLDQLTDASQAKLERELALKAEQEHERRVVHLQLLSLLDHDGVGDGQLLLRWTSRGE